MLKTTGARLFATFLGYITLIIVLLTLNPFYLAWPNQVSFRFESSLNNLVSNIVLFLPVGFLYKLSTGRRGALLLGAGMSLGIETLQLFIPARTASIVDIMANALGAGIGAVAYDLISNRITVSQGMLNRLRLETPLMGAAYLLVPLLWINTLALNEAPYHWILTGLIGLCGAILFGELFRHWRAGTDFKTYLFATLASGAWFLVGAGTTLLRSAFIAAIWIEVMVLTGILAALPLSFKDRRFERNTLKYLIPVFVVYLGLLALWFPFELFGDWHFIFGFTERAEDTSLQFLYPRVEFMAAFTVLGYLTAEWRGRLELTLVQDLPRLFVIAATAALLLEFFSGFQAARGASLVRWVLAVTSALFGGSIYYRFRAHIRFLLGR